MPEEPGPVVGHAVSTASLVDVQSGAVVSREVISKPQGTVSVFAFVEGEGLSEHTAPFDALVQVLDGKAELTIGGELVKAGAGETVLMPANVPNSLHAPEPFKMLLTMIRG